MPKRVHGSVEMPSSDGEVSGRGSVLWSDKGTKRVQGSTGERFIQVQIHYYDKGPAKRAQHFPLVVVPLGNDCTLLLFSCGGVLIHSTSSSVQLICLWKLVLMIWRLSVFILAFKMHGKKAWWSLFMSWALGAILFIYSNSGSSATAASGNNHNCRPWFKEKRFAQVAYFFYYYYYFKIFIRNIYFSSLELQRFPQGFEGLNNMYEMVYLLVIKGVCADMCMCTVPGRGWRESIHKALLRGIKPK